ncbi:hypothetical protein [Phenylobacterium sp.]|uniref:hypothetical protein n=1 Tax=Phenylobacterium sp. TaxID=1871053 RepID=UPI002FE3D036
MAKDEQGSWIARAVALAGQHGAGPAQSWREIADRLVEVDRLIRDAPKRIRNSYARLKEEDIRDAAEARYAELEEEDAGWRPVTDGAPSDLIWPAAIEARALDLLLRRHRPREVPRDANTDWRHGDYFVAPCRERRLGRHGRDRQPYERRGLLHHRILPVRIGAYDVQLSGGGSVSDDEPGLARRLQAGAALFEGLEYDLNIGDGVFTARRIAAPDHPEQIEAALRAAHAAGCETIAWPELTIWREDREQIAAWLQDRILHEDFDGGRLELVLAGSCHEPSDDGRGTVNRGCVFNAYGEELLIFDKLVAFHDYPHGTEDIIESMTIPVLVLEDMLIAFGICRDFSDTGPDNPLAVLDVDMLMVPSMGNERTAEGHLTTARLVADRFAAVSFVVQQADPGEPLQPGYVVPPQDDLTGLSAASIHQATRFQVHPSAGGGDTTPKIMV